MASNSGLFTELNLGPLFDGVGSHAPLNLGVRWDDAPPDPVVRGLRNQVSATWLPAARKQVLVAANWQKNSRQQLDARVAWSGGARKSRSACDLGWGGSPTVFAIGELNWGASVDCRRATRSLWHSLDRECHGSALLWGKQGRCCGSARMAWHQKSVWHWNSSLTWLQGVLRRRATDPLRWMSPGLKRMAAGVPWGLGTPVPWIVRPAPEKPEPPEPSPFPPGDKVALNLGCPVFGMSGVVPLNLGVTACYTVRPHKGTYIVLNTVSVVRLPDRAPIEVESVSINGSAGAWGYDIDLSLANPAHLALLKPTSGGRREVEVTVNGYVWTAVIENYSHRREFVRSGVTVTGRSRTALLAAPYAPARALVSVAIRSMAQLASDELADTGYTIDWETVDWPVPAGAWYYDGMTALDAVGALAEASGAVVQSDPGGKHLRVLPRYPVSPWNWPDASPDHVVQDDIVITESGQVRSAPVYNAVVVTGELAGAGVTARVVREGEAGDLYAPQASSPLITVAAAARERGRNILADRGEQDDIDLTLPLFPLPVAAGATGRVLPLQLIEVRGATGTWHGQCTAIRIDARVSGNAITVEQTITLERHYTDAN